MVNISSNLFASGNIKWKQYYHNPTIFWTQVAKMNHEHGLVASNKSGVCQLYSWIIESGELTQITNKPNGVIFGELSPNGRFVYYLDDNNGNEIGHYVCVPFEGGHQQIITPKMTPYSSSGLFISLACNVIGFTTATKNNFNLYVILFDKNDTYSTPRLFYKSKDSIENVSFSNDGKFIAINLCKYLNAPLFYLKVFNTRSGKLIRELWGTAKNNFKSFDFSPVNDDTRLLVTDDRTGVTRPIIWNPITNEFTYLLIEGIKGDFLPIDWSSNGNIILLSRIKNAVQHLYLYDIANQILSPLNHPDGTFGAYKKLGMYFNKKGNIFTQWQNSTHSPQLIELDGKTGVQLRVILKHNNIRSEHPWKNIRFTSSEGSIIQGWLGLPNGKGPFPTIIDIHGGPEMVNTEVFSPNSQTWIDYGFAFLSINYRGSITFGKKFNECIWGNPGHYEILDIIAARKWLVEQGISMHNEIILSGWSYGGYLTLLALGKNPRLWCGGIACNPIIDWRILFEDSANNIKKYAVALLGGEPDKKQNQYNYSSPITYAKQISAPILIIQGRNDTRTPPRQVTIFKKKMKSLGKHLEVCWYNSGHLSSIVQIEQAIEHQESMIRFVHKILNLNK